MTTITNNDCVKQRLRNLDFPGEVDSHEARDWLAETISDALDEAKAERSFTDDEDLPAQERRVTALSDSLALVRTYQATAPLVEKARVLCVADRARGLRPNTISPLFVLALHRPQDDLDAWINEWTTWAISVEGLEGAA